MVIYEKIAREIEQHLQHLSSMPPSNPLIVVISSLMEATLMARSSRDIASAIALLQKVTSCGLY
jgi:hypothetical protein